MRALAVMVVGMLAVGCSAVREPAVSGPPIDLGAPLGPASELELACVRNSRIDAWERRLRSAAWRDAMHEDAVRGARYLPRLRQMVVDAGLPPAIAFLPAIESGFRPDARGSLDELGLWQLRPDTARRFGLVVEGPADERLHPDQSTRAAVRYLRYLYARYGDWPLALAAYNAGEGCVDRALQRRPTATFWDLAAHGVLPAKSREYVPHFLAVVRIRQGRKMCDPPTPLLASSGSL